MRRLVKAAHLLRLDAQDEQRREAFPDLAPLATDVDAMLALVGGVLRAGPGAPTSHTADLRADYMQLERERASGESGENRADLLSDPVTHGIAGRHTLGCPEWTPAEGNRKANTVD